MNKGILAIATLIIALIAWVFVLSYPFFIDEKQKSNAIKLFIVFMLTTMIFILPMISFYKISHEMWDTEVYPGAIRNSQIDNLMGIHMLFLLMFMVLVIKLWIKFFQRFSMTNWFTILGSFVFFVCINVSFYYTFPRHGNEGVEILLFSLVGFFFADLILIITIILFSIVCLVRQIKAKNAVRIASEA